MTQLSIFNSSKPDWLTLKFSKRAKRSWRFEWKKASGPWSWFKKRNQAVLTLPSYFQHPELKDIFPFLYEWAEITMERQTSQRKKQKRSLEKQIWQLIEDKKSNISAEIPPARQRFPQITPQGSFHNVQEHFDFVNRKYFGGELQACITWSTRIGGQSFHSLRTNARGEKVHLISISRGYDFANCPLEALRGVIYHECLHIAVPPHTVNGRRVVHGKEFRRREKFYEHYDLWIKWHAEVLPRNVRTLKRKAK